MFKGEVCKFYELASKDNSQDVCLGDYDTNASFYIAAAGFRYTALVLSLFLPVGFLVIEFMQNQLLLVWKHLIYQYIFTAFYALVTLLWQTGTGSAVIFPDSLDWICGWESDATGPTREPNTGGSCLFSDCFLWFGVFMLVQTGCFAALLLLHYAKSKFCCRRPVQLSSDSVVYSAAGQSTLLVGK